MTYQDEFARRLAQQGAAAGEGGDPPLACHPRAGGNPDGTAGADENAGTLDPRLRGDDKEGGDDTEESGDNHNPVRPEPVEGRSCSAPDAEPCDTSTDGPADAQGSASSAEHTPTIRHDGWHPDLRVKFLEALARTGNVGAAAQYVQRSRQSAYDLKRRDPDFARAWLAALLLARDVAQDVLQERAVEGVEEEIFYHGEVVATRRRYDSRLLLAHLARLDKIAEQIPAQRGAARFADMLAAIGRGEDTAPLIATPTEDELAEAAARVEVQHGPPEEEGEEFHMVTWPDDDGPPEFLRMCPEEIEEMQREIPGIVITPTGTRDDEVVERLITLSLYDDYGEYDDEEEEEDADEAEEDEEGKNL